MMPISVFYHCWLPDNRAVHVLCEQASALKQSGLESAAQEIHVGLNGDPLGAEIIRSVMPSAKISVHEANVLGEAFTIKLLQQWLPGHENWAVCYHHIKGISHAPNDAYANWRRCLEREVIWQWRRCVADLERGFETVGAHWHTPFDQQYWAGTFWWANSNYLRQLPPVDEKTVSGRSYESEVWIGKCGRKPRIVNYTHHGLLACPA